MCVHAYTGYCSQACVYMHTQAIVLKHVCTCPCNYVYQQKHWRIAVLVETGIFHWWALVSGGVYKNWCLDVLEGSFTLNLIILVGATHYVNHSGGNQLAVGYTSAFIALKTFVGILLYQIIQQLRHTKLWKRMPILNFKFRKLNSKIIKAIRLATPRNLTNFVNLCSMTCHNPHTVLCENFAFVCLHSRFT